MQENASLPVVKPSAPVIHLDAERIDLIRRTVAENLNQDELELFIYQAKRCGLDPLARQIYALKNRAGKVSIQVSIDGFRLVAERTGQYAGQIGPHWCGDDGKWVEVWTSSKPPIAARVGVLKTTFSQPLYAVARFQSYNQNSPTWTKMPDLMIAKVAESLALRRAFPNELSGLYTSEEMPVEAVGNHRPSVNNSAARIAMEAIDSVPDEYCRGALMDAQGVPFSDMAFEELQRVHGALRHWAQGAKNERHRANIGLIARAAEKVLNARSDEHNSRSEYADRQ